MPEPKGPRPGTAKKPATRAKRRKPADPARAWARRLARSRPGLIDFVFEGLRSIYGRPTWRRRLDPTSELVLTILSQNSADVNAERAFESLRAAFPGTDGKTTGHAERSSDDAPEGAGRHDGWGGRGLRLGSIPDWAKVETAPIDQLVEAIRPGGLAVQKAPRIQAALRMLREQRGDYSLEFLGDMAARDARDWLTNVSGIGRKTASVVLMFSFGHQLMPVDRHVERVAKRIGLIPAKATADDAHELFLAMLEPHQTYEAHVNLIRHGREICHARNPRHEICPVATRCRLVNPKAE